MRVDQIPKLQTFVSPEEFKHIQAFPSILRLVVSGKLIAAMKEKPDCARARFHRVIDNAPLELSGADLWEHLNFQLIHMLDFLPAAQWGRSWNRLVECFLELYEFLKESGHLEAHIDLSLTPPPTPAVPLPPTFAHILTELIPVVRPPLLEKYSISPRPTESSSGSAVVHQAELPVLRHRGQAQQGNRLHERDRTRMSPTFLAVACVLGGAFVDAAGSRRLGADSDPRSTEVHADCRALIWQSPTRSCQWPRRFCLGSRRNLHVCAQASLSEFTLDL